MEFTQEELLYISECLNFHYDEHRGTTYSKSFIDINSQLCRKIDEQLQLHRRAF